MKNIVIKIYECMNTILVNKMNHIIIISKMEEKAGFEKKKVAMEKIESFQRTTIKLIKQLTLTQKSKKISQDVRLRNLSDININLYQIEKINPLQNQMFANQKLIVFVRHFLIDNSNSNKIPPLQFFRLVLVSETVADRFLAHSIPLYISRVIEREDATKAKSPLNSHYQQQIFQALRLMKHWIQKFPSKFPQFLAFCLVALTELPVATNIQDRKKDQIPQHIKNFAIDILLIMSIKNTKLCCICGGFTLLINSITDPTLHEKSYDIISKILIFVNDVKFRDLTSPYIDFKRVFHVLTDLDNVFLEENYKTRNNLEMLSRFQSRLGLAKNAIVTLLKSWVGLIYIGNDPSAIHSLLQTLKQIPKKYDSELRNLIFEALQQILSAGDNIITTATTQQKHNFKISSLVGCYLMTVVQLLVQQNLLRILIQLTGVDQSLVSQPSQRLLKRLTFLIFSYRPEYSKHIDFLITAANKSNGSTSQMLKTSSSFVINKISNYIYQKKQKKNHTMFNQLQNLFSLKTIFTPFSRSSLNSISKTLNFINYKQKVQYRKNLLQKQPISKQHKQNYMRWKWDVIEDLLQFPDPDKFKPSTNQRYRQNKMYKYLLRFYSPSRGNFYKLDWHSTNFVFIKIGMMLVRNSITIPQNLPLVKNPPQSQFQCTVSFIGDLQKWLQINITQCIKNSRQWNIVLCTKLQRQLMGFIGLLSQTKLGYQSLICQNRFLQLLHGCLAREQCSHLIYLILINLDFYRDDINKVITRNTNGNINIKFYPANYVLPVNQASNNVTMVKIGVRHLFQVCIKEGSVSLKLACVEIIKILLAAEVYTFTIFSYQLLINILQNQQEKSEIIKVVVQFLEENLTNQSNVQLFIKVLSDMIIDFQSKSLNLDKSNSNSSNNSNNEPKQKQKPKQEQKKIQSEQQLPKNVSFYSQFSKFGINTKNKLKFQQIKQKLTTPIITRLLSNSAGIQLAQRFMPDWLQQQYQKWMSADHNYCSTLEYKLNSVLNFTKKKQRGYYKITSSTHVYDLFFMYKLPWVVHINEHKFPLWVRQKGNFYQFYYNFGAFGDGKDMENALVIGSDSLKVLLGIGTMLVDQEFNTINQSENVSPLTIFLTMGTKQVQFCGEKVSFVESNGVEVYFRKNMLDKKALKQMKQEMSEQWESYSSHVQDLNKIQVLRIVINVKLPTVEHTEQLPLHLINQLSKTQKGRKFLQNKKYVQRAGTTLQNFLQSRSPIPSGAEVRSILWSLGFFGSRNQGAWILQKSKIFDKIIKLTFNSPILSLRGTCRYVLNMFSHSEHGRNLLKENGFHVNSSCFSCYPLQIKNFYRIENIGNKKHYISNQLYWQAYNQLQKPMTKNEQKLFQLISLLINSLSFKSAVSQIRQILKISPKMSHSINLLQNVVNLLTFFKYKHESRKSIMNVFDQLMRSPQFNSETGNKIVFFINEEQSRRKNSSQLPTIKSQGMLEDIKFEQKIDGIKSQANLTS